MNALFNTCCKKMLGLCGLLKSFFFFPETNCRTSPRPFNFQIPVIKMSNIVRIWQGHSFLPPFHFHINFSEGQICWRRGGGEETCRPCAHGRLKYDLFTVSLIVQDLMILDGDNLEVHFTLCPKSSHCQCNLSCRLRILSTNDLTFNSNWPAMPKIPRATDVVPYWLFSCQSSLKTRKPFLILVMQSILRHFSIRTNS